MHDDAHDRDARAERLLRQSSYLGLYTGFGAKAARHLRRAEAMSDYHRERLQVAREYLRVCGDTLGTCAETLARVERLLERRGRGGR